VTNWVTIEAHNSENPRTSGGPFEQLIGTPSAGQRPALVAWGQVVNVALFRAVAQGPETRERGKFGRDTGSLSGVDMRDVFGGWVVDRRAGRPLAPSRSAQLSGANFLADISFDLIEEDFTVYRRRGSSILA
jgi:hypothetical protein